MSGGNIRISVWSNNSSLEDSFLAKNLVENFEFHDLKNNSSIPYVLVLIDLSQELTNISQEIISIYGQVSQKNQKLIVLILETDEVDTEINLYLIGLLDKLGSEKPIHRIVFTKDVFQPNFLSSDTYLEKYLLEGISNRKLSISIKGDRVFFPIIYTDLIKALQKIFFLNGTAGKKFWILGDPITDLEVGYLIKKALEDSEGPEFEIDTVIQSAKPTLDLNSLGNQSRALLNWEPKEDFSNYLKSAVKQIGEDRSLLLTKLNNHQDKQKQPNWKKNFAKVKHAFTLFSKFKPKKGIKKTIESGPQLIKIVIEYTLALVVSAYLLFSLMYVGFTALSLKYLEQTLGDIRNGNISISVQSLKQSQLFAKIGETGYSIVSPVISYFAGDFHAKNYNTFVFLHYSQASLSNLQQTYQLAEKIYQSLGTSTSSNFYEDSSLALRSNLSQIYENINQIDLLTKNGKLPQILESRLNNSNEFKNLKQIELQLTELIKTTELIPGFLGGKTPKNIVILFQNSHELRSTGGTIDYVLVLVLEQGKLVSRKIYRSDEIDKLAGNLALAPPLVRLYTGEDSWKFRDMNYNPDFPQTATNISWFVENVLKFKPDVILATTDRLISNMLTEDKGVLLDGQNISSEIFQTEMSTLSPSPLYVKLVDYYLDQLLSHKAPLIQLGRVIASQSETNGLLFWSSDLSLETSIVNQPFSGAIYPHSCQSGVSNSQSCITQTTYFNESNYSLIPIGKKLQRIIAHNISVQDSQVNHEYSVEYQFKEIIPDINRNYNEIIQIYAPAGSLLDQVDLDGNNISLRGVISESSNQLERFQIPISFSFNQSHNLNIKFHSPLSKLNRLPYAYSQSEIHQSGINDLDTRLTIKVPDSARTVAITSAVTSGPDSISLLLPAKNTTFGVSFELSNQ